MEPALTRRAFVGRLIGPTLLVLSAACTGQVPASPTSPPTLAPASVAPTPAAGAATGGKSGSPLPSFIPSQAVKADLPPPVSGVDAGYLAYPRNPAPSVTD